MSTWFAALAAGFALALPLTAAARPAARRLGQLDHPGGRKRHREPMPVAGGVAVFWAVALPAAAALALSAAGGAGAWTAVVRGREAELATVLACAFGLHLLGLVDDRRQLGAGVKLLGQVLAALPLVLLFDVQLLPRWLGTAPSAALTLIWFLAVVNAFNFIDGLDGLLGGVGAICATLLGITALATGQLSTATLLALLAGALLGFLAFNRPPASIFMGDGGSLVVGYLIAYASVRITYAHPGAPEATPWYAVFTPLVILAIPLYDLVTVVVLRLARVANPAEADNRHFSHRLQRRGMSDRKVLVVVCACTLATGMGGVMLIDLEAWQAVLVAVQTAIILLVLALLESAPEAAEWR